MATSREAQESPEEQQLPELRAHLLDPDALQKGLFCVQYCITYLHTLPNCLALCDIGTISIKRYQRSSGLII
jgi:hypothetical protein